MSVPSTRFLVLIYLLCIANCRDISAQKEKDKEEGKVYIVYLGHKEHDDVERITNSHYDILTRVLGSKVAPEKAMVYNYKHGFSGFAAKLTESQAQHLEELPEVVEVMESKVYKKRTLRSFEMMGLPVENLLNNNDLMHQAKMGDGMIIGIIDSGIWPESESFRDDGLGPIPSRWKGECEEALDGSFDPKKHCNRKLIGARYFIRTMMAVKNYTYDPKENSDFLSARDGPPSHGTHIAGTAAGSIIHNVSRSGMKPGTIRGAAPKARIAVYKVCWGESGDLNCYGADMLAAMDQAIMDGVDVIQISLGGSGLPINLEIEKMNAVAMGAYHAFLKGIAVVAAAGNEGPIPGSVNNLAPWLLDVGASTVDRSFPTPIYLRNITFLGQGTFDGKKGGPYKIHYEGECNNILDVQSPDLYEDSCRKVEGKVFMCFTTLPNFDVRSLIRRVTDCGGIGILCSKTESDILITSQEGSAFLVNIGYEDGCKLTRYYSPTEDVKVGPSIHLEGKAVPVRVAYFSARGPSTAAPEVLKPDIVAPGSNIIAAVSPRSVDHINGYGIKSGTSMAAPHVSGTVLLLRAIHPDWSPSCIFSAIITTGKTLDDSGFPIYANGEPPKPADPFDIGGGLINPSAAADPGLVYEIRKSGYEDYLCAMHYRRAGIARLVRRNVKCPLEPPSLFDFNIPSMTIPSLRSPTKLTRTVTNVGPVDSVYKAIINPPDGVIVEVQPEVLVFNSNVKKATYTMTVTPTKKANLGFYTFGSIIWSDSIHSVRSPISVNIEAFEA